MNRRRHLITFAGIAFCAVVLINSFVGMRCWPSIYDGQTRASVHALLGYPDGRFMPKGWGGWYQSGIIGAWVITIYYDEKERVTHVKKEFCWGLDYLVWG